MADNSSVAFSVTANVQSAVDSVKNLETIAVDSVDKISQSFNNLKELATAALEVLAAHEAFEFLAGAVTESEAAEDATNQLKNTLIGLGQYTPELASQFEEFSKNLQDNSKFSSEAADQQLALAKQLGLSDSAAEQLVQTSADLATRTGKDLPTAFSELAASLQGHIRSLALVAPGVKGFTADQLAAGAAIDYVAQITSGAAAAALNSYSGALIQTGFAFKDFKVGLGDIITQNPVVIALISQTADVFKSLTATLNSHATDVSNYIGIITKLGVEALPAAITALRIFSDGISAIVVVSGAAVTAATAVAAAFLNFGPVKDSVQAAVNGMLTLFEELLTGLGSVLTLISELPGASDAFKALGVDVTAVGQSIANTVTSLEGFKIDGTTIKAAADGFSQLSDSAGAFTQTALDAATATDQGFRDISTAVSDASKVILDADNAQSAASRAAAQQATIDSQAKIKASVDAANAAAAEAEAQKKLQPEYEAAGKLLDQLYLNSLSDSDKVEAERQIQLEKVQNFYDETVISADDASTAIDEINQIANDKQIDLLVKQEEAFDAFQDKVLSGSTDSISKINLAQQNSLDQLQGFLDAGTVSTEDAENLRVAITEDANDKIYKATVKDNQEAANAITSFTQSGIQGLASSGISALTDSLVPGFGAAAGQIFNLLSENTTDFAATMNQLFSVQFIQNVASNLETLVEKLPAIIPKIVEAFNSEPVISGIIQAIIVAGPQISIALFKAFTNPQLYIGIVTGIINGILGGIHESGKQMATDFKTNFEDGFGQATSKIGGYLTSAFETALSNIKDEVAKIFNISIGAPSSSSGGVVGTVAKAGKAIVNTLTGHAAGGVIPSGFPDDTYPAALTSGELVIPKDLVSGVERLVAANDAGQNSSSNMGQAGMNLLSQIVSLLSQPTTVSTTAQVNGKALADIILQLNRGNARLA